ETVTAASAIIPAAEPQVPAAIIIAAPVHEVVEVVTAAKLVYEVTVSSETVTAASAIILAAEP
nr:hypothetical protein [Tanacetum cinerariifolium]